MLSKESIMNLSSVYLQQAQNAFFLLYVTGESRRTILTSSTVGDSPQATLIELHIRLDTKLLSIKSKRISQHTPNKL